MNDKYKISVIIPCLNAEALIADCINSILMQDYCNIEIIVVDGLSTDRTINILSNLIVDVDHKIISEKDNGIYDAINKGIDLASGDYLIVLGSDDVFYDNTVLTRVFLSNFKYADFIYGNVIFKSTNTKYDGKFNIIKLMTKNICHQAIFYHKSIYEKLGKYDIKYKALGDMLLNIRCFESGDISIRYVDEIISIYNDRGYSSTFDDTIYFEDLPNNLKKYCSEDVLNYQLTIRQVVDLNQALAERDGQIADFNQAQDYLTSHHLQQKRELQELVVELRNEIEAYHSSTSWRITRPLREVSHLWKQLIRLAWIYQNYRQKYPGINGVKRMLCRSVDAIRKDGINGLRNNMSIHQRVTNNISVLAEFEALQSNAHRINVLHSRLKKSLVVKPTILFDHNGGGGSNLYTQELVKIICADGGNVLRVYYFEAAWFIQWIIDGEEILYYTPSIEELFDTLLASCSMSVVINSLYGYPDIKMAVSNMVTLSRTLCATLDYKIHDFYALCPSPHLSNSEDKYCGVPQDFELCFPCLKRNFRWYHSWYPKNNMPVDISEWRKPFATLFEAVTTVTFFDCSSVEIVQKAFRLDDRKINITPHLINYFNCDTSTDVTGALHIGILGTLSDIKGGGVVKALFEHIDRQGLRIPITVVGHSFVDLPSKIKVYGHYERSDLPVIIRENNINVILMPTIVPETFSYTISEAMQMGLPIVAFDIGAQGCRVKQYALGKVIPIDSAPEVILSAIQSVLKTAQELKI